MKSTIAIFITFILFCSCEEEQEPFVYENPMVGTWEIASVDYDGSVREDFGNMTIAFESVNQTSGSYTISNLPSGALTECLWEEKGIWKFYFGGSTVEVPDSSDVLPRGNLIFDETDEYVVSYSEKGSGKSLFFSFDKPRCHPDSVGRTDISGSFWAFTFSKKE